MKITTEELNELLQKEFERGRQSAINDINNIESNTDMIFPYKPYTAEDLLPKACKKCPNHPSNGGSGICHCMLGLEPINYITTTTFSL